MFRNHAENAGVSIRSFTDMGEPEDKWSPTFQLRKARIHPYNSGTFFLKMNITAAIVMMAMNMTSSNVSWLVAFLLIITCRSMIMTKEVTMVAGTDLRIMPIMNGHSDSIVHTITVVIVEGIHV